MSSPEQLFADLLSARPANPFVTYYDEATGERSELSAKSLANWVAKTHHLLVTELGLGAGDTAVVRLPAHWISVPVLLGCLTAGLAVDTDGRADVGFGTGQDHLDAADVFAIDIQRAATGFGATPPPGTQDYVTAVRPQADAWASVQFGAAEADRCLGARSRAEVAAAATQRAADLGFGPRARVLSVRSWGTPDDWIDTLFAPLAVGGSVVYAANCSDDAVLDRRADQERVTDRA